MRDRPSDKYRQTLALKLGRKLTANEVADHVDEDKANNSAGNLRPMSRAAHTAMHAANRPLSKLRAALRMTREGRKLY